MGVKKTLLGLESVVNYIPRKGAELGAKLVGGDAAPASRCVGAVGGYLGLLALASFVPFDNGWVRDIVMVASPALAIYKSVVDKE